MVYASQFIFDREKNLIVKQVKNTNAKFQWFQSRFQRTRTFEHCETSVRISYLFQYSQIQIDRIEPRSSKPSMNSFVRGRSCLFLPRTPGVLFHSVSRKHFLYGTIFRRNLNEMEFLVERDKKKLNEGMIKILEEIIEEYIFSFLIIIIIISLKRYSTKTKMNILDYFPYFRQIPWKLL